MSAPDLCCPACRSPVAQAGDELACGSCKRRYPVIAGIPDMRLGYADEYLGLEQDRERARALAARIEELSFAELLAEHWRISGRPPELAARFHAGDLATAARSDAYVAAIEAHRGARLRPGEPFLEAGCGTAGLAGAAAARGAAAVATDASLRWLVLARKRLQEAGSGGVGLVCASAEALPFADGVFPVAGASDVIEHVRDPIAFAAGCARVLAPGGLLFLATPNRFSLGLEPHVRVWGVGWLPRPLQGPYVRQVRGASYDHVRLLSARGLRRALRAAGLEPSIVAPEIPAASQALYRGPELAAVRAYNKARRLPAARQVLEAVGPFFHVFARRPEG